MSNDPVVDIAKELAKQIPLKDAYDDLVSPPAKVLGITFEDIAKTLQLALAPLQVTAALQDRLRRFIDRAIRGIPDARLVTPAPQIVGPIIEGIKYEVEGTPIEEMFKNLLSSASDKDRVGDAHPAFAHLIRQISADEAALLQAIHDQALPRFQRRTISPWDRDTGTFGPAETIDEGFPIDRLAYKENLEFYVDHLWSLGLAGLFRSDEKPIMSAGMQTGTDLTREYRLTEFGQRFMKATNPSS